MIKKVSRRLRLRKNYKQDTELLFEILFDCNQSRFDSIRFHSIRFNMTDYLSVAYSSSFYSIERMIAVEEEEACADTGAAGPTSM